MLNKDHFNKYTMHARSMIVLWEEALQQVLTLDNKIGISVGKYTDNCN